MRAGAASAEAAAPKRSSRRVSLVICRSEPTRAGFTTEQFADDVFAVADHLDAREVVLVAFSMSGRWAQWMSCTRPTRVIGQVLLAPVPAVALPLTDAMCDQWIESVRTRAAFEGFARQFTRNALPPDVLDDYFADAGSTPEHSLRETFRMCCQPGFTESLAATRAATLILGGTYDPMFTPDSLRQEILSKIPGARMSLVDCGHELPLEAPAETAAAIQAFLAGI